MEKEEEIKGGGEVFMARYGASAGQVTAQAKSVTKNEDCLFPQTRKAELWPANEGGAN